MLDIIKYIQTQISHPATVMAIALCFHFLGNEFARAASTSLLASKDFGLGSEALSYTVIIGSPISALILYLYTNSIKSRGPYLTLLISNIVCVLFFTYITFILSTLRGSWGKFILLVYYSFREIYVTLLSTQQWSFIATVLNKSKSSHMVQYSGLISVASAIGGLLVEHIVKYGGVQCLLYMALLATVLSWLCDEIAYSMVKDHNVACTKVLLQRAEMKQSAISKQMKKRNFWLAAGELIYQNDTLRILFFEALIHQLCGNILNITFHDGLRKSIPDSGLRAVVVGRFFASVNTIACVLQCFVLPYMLSHKTLPQFLLIIPVIVLISVVLSCFDRTDLFLQDTIAFGAVKILEYSIMTSATEMIYMPLDCEVRYIGKEFIRFFGHRLGKSAASIVLCTLNVRYQWSHLSQSGLAIIFALIWEVIMIGLAHHIITQNDRSIPSNNSNNNSTTSSKNPQYTSPVQANNLSIRLTRALDPQTLSTSRSTAYLPDIFQWSSANSSSQVSLSTLVSSHSNTRLSSDGLNVMNTGFGSTGMGLSSSSSSNLNSYYNKGISSSRSSSFETVASNDEDRVRSNSMTLRDVDIGLSLTSRDENDDYDEQKMDDHNHNNHYHNNHHNDHNQNHDIIRRPSYMRRGQYYTHKEDNKEDYTDDINQSEEEYDRKGRKDVKKTKKEEEEEEQEEDWTSKPLLYHIISLKDLSKSMSQSLASTIYRTISDTSGETDNTTEEATSVVGNGESVVLSNSIISTTPKDLNIKDSLSNTTSGLRRRRGMGSQDITSSSGELTSVENVGAISTSFDGESLSIPRRRQ